MLSRTHSSQLCCDEVDELTSELPCDIVSRGPSVGVSTYIPHAANDTYRKMRHTQQDQQARRQDGGVLPCVHPSIVIPKQGKHDRKERVLQGLDRDANDYKECIDTK